MALRQQILRLYAAQLRTARYFDRLPQLKPLLSVEGASSFAATRQSGTTAPAVQEVTEHYRRAFLGECKVYLPPRSLTDFVRQAYAEAAYGIVQERGTDVDADVPVKLDAAFNLQREMKQAADLYHALHASDDVKLPSLSAACPSDITEAPVLTPGVLMVDHPAVVRPGRTLALVYDISRNLPELHGNEKWMVRSYVVNRPYPHTVEAVTKMQGLGAFGKLPLFHGGMEGDQLSVIHRISTLEGSTPIDEAGTIFAGGNVAAINILLGNGKAKPDDFKVILGHSELQLVGGDDDLSLEDPNRWIFAGGAGAHEVAMLPPQFDTTGQFRDGKGLGVNETIEGYNYGRFWHQNAAWSHVARRMGQWLQRDGASEEERAKGAEWESFADLHPAVVHILSAAGPLVLQTPYSAAEPAESASAAQPSPPPGPSTQA